MPTPTLPIATFPNEVWVGYGPQAGDAGLLAQVTPNPIDWSRVVAELQATQQYILDNQGGGGPILDRSIEGVKLVLKTVGTTEIADDAITSLQLANDAVDTNAIQAGAVTTTKLDTGVVTTVKLADGSVTTIKVVDGAITLAKLDAASVDTTKLTDSSVTTVKILDANVTTIKIADLNVTTGKLADDAVTTLKIVNGNVTQAKLANNAVATVNILDANVTAAKLATGAALSNLVDGTVNGAKLVAGSVTSTELANNAVTTVKVADVAITTAKLADASVTNGKLALLAVDTGNIIDGAVTSTKLATGAALANIGSGTITASLLGTDSVGATQLADNAVDTAAIANGAVTTVKLDNLAVTTGKLVDNSVTLAKLDQLAQNTFLGRTAAGTGNVEALSVASVKTVLDLAGTNTGDQTITLTGPVTGTGTGTFATSISAGVVGTTELANSSVTLAKLGSDITAAGKSLLDDASAADQRTTLGLGTAALSTAEPSGLSGADANLPSNKMVKDFLIANYQDLAAKNLANGYAGLDSGGKLPTSILPDLAIVDYLGSVANQTAMLALTGQKGDWCTRSDLGTNFIITGGTPSSLGSWTELSYPAGGGGGGPTTLSGDVTGTGTGTITTTIATAAVSLAKMADIATATFIGRTTAGTGVPEALSVSQAKGLLNLSNTNSGDVTLAGESYLSLAGQAITAAAVDLSGTHATGTLAAGRFPALTGDITTVAGNLATSLANNAVTTLKITDLNVTTAKLADGAVTLGKLADVATASFIGRTTAGTGSPEVLAVNDAKALLNLTGTNSGDQTITLTGDATGSGTGSFAVTIANDAVTTIKILNNNITHAKLAQVATQTFLGRNTAATGDVETLTVATAKTMLGVTGTNTGDQTITLTGAVTGTGTGSFATTYGTMATKTVLGNSTGSTASPTAVRCAYYSITMQNSPTKDIMLVNDVDQSADAGTPQGVMLGYYRGLADATPVYGRGWYETSLASVRAYTGTGMITQLAQAMSGTPSVALLSMATGTGEGIYELHGFGDATWAAGSSYNAVMTLVNRSSNMGGQAKAVWMLKPNSGSAVAGGAINIQDTQFLWPEESVQVLRHHGGNASDNYKILTKKRFFSDFDQVDHHVSLTGPLSGTSNVSGTVTQGASGTAGLMGYLNLSTSATSSSRVYAGQSIAGNAISYRTANNHNAYWVYATRIRIPTLSDATNTFFVRSGFHDAANFSTPTNGLYFEYTHTLGVFQACRAAAAVITKTSSATTVVAGTWYDLMIIMWEGTGSYAHFLLSTDQRRNWTYVAALDSGHLTTTAAIYSGIGTGITKSVGTAGRTVDIDYQAIRWPVNP